MFTEFTVVFRHKQAQYAGRASVLLNTILYFKGRTELHDGFIMGIRKNGIQVNFRQLFVAYLLTNP